MSKDREFISKLKEWAIKLQDSNCGGAIGNWPGVEQGKYAVAKAIINKINTHQISMIGETNET